MDGAFLEQLLYEDESSTLDFKRAQYKFVKATNDDKSELLKDILGFVNGWRRPDAYILIGVEEVVGGRSKVLGVTDHLPDHSLQQFVNSLTNRPVRFGYEACPIDGMQIGVICIELQQRPIYLKRDFGKLKAGEVYVRRGSSTDPTKLASPDEIAQMGMARSEAVEQAALVVEFADPDRDIILGNQIPCSAELCRMPEFKDIPSLTRPQRSRPRGQGHLDLVRLSDLDLGLSADVLNSQFYRETANFVAFKRCFRQVRLVVTNEAEVAAHDVRIEISIPRAQRIAIPLASEVPDTPKRKHSRFGIDQRFLNDIRPAHAGPGYVDIDRNDDRVKLEIECRDLQPGRKVWSNKFYMGIFESGQFTLSGHSLATNQSAPKAFTLTVDAEITETSMTVDELIELANSRPD